MPSKASITVFKHDDPVRSLLPRLLPFLPHSLPLVRRIQFHYQTPYAAVFSTLRPDGSDVRSGGNGVQTAPDFAASYVDRSRAPETECWLFSSAESESSGSIASDDDARGVFRVEKRSRPVDQAHLIAILAATARNPLPAHPHFRTSHSPRILLVGTMNSHVYEMLKSVDIPSDDGDNHMASLPRARDESGEPVSVEIERDILVKQLAGRDQDSGGVLAGRTEPYVKYLFPPSPDNSVVVRGDELPAAIRWGTVGELSHDYELVLSRTDIPRSEGTLKMLPSIALRRGHANGGGEAQDNEMIAWGFLGVDGSLVSLHVEEEFRGRGLGKLVSQKLFDTLRSGGGMVDGKAALTSTDREHAWGHADVSEGNASSRKVMAGLGGMAMWEDYWCWVDLGKVLSVEHSIWNHVEASETTIDDPTQVQV